MALHQNEKREPVAASNFLVRLVEKDVNEGWIVEKVRTRFPPEPNGYLHIGSAYAIHINYTIAQQFNGDFHLRFDDTNPAKEEHEFVQAIQEDMVWLGYDWGEKLYFGSDYFEELYLLAIKLIQKGKAYVCDLTPAEIREYRGTLTEAGKDSPYRNRPIEENLRLFKQMRTGAYEEGSRVLRAKIDMESANINMRDPVMYRIIKTEHYRTKEAWPIYPMYDYAHPLQDAIEKISHSLCSIEFRDHRPLYEWFLEELEIKDGPKQREFGRMNLNGVVTSKRYLREMVEQGVVDGWDDPRLPTLKGLRRRGYTPEAIQHFLEEIGLSRSESMVDLAMLEHSIRQDLQPQAPRMMAVLHPLKVVITNYPDHEVEWLEVDLHPDQPELGKRKIPFSKVIYIDREDFMENPPKKYYRLFPGNEVRLMHAYWITCQKVIKNRDGQITELHCTYDPQTKSGTGFTERKVKGTLHWLSAEHALQAEVRLYDRLLLDEEEGEKNWSVRLNPNSLEVKESCYIEPALKGVAVESKVQFIRHGYFCVDTKYTTTDKLVFNRIVPLKDTWQKLKKKQSSS